MRTSFHSLFFLGGFVLASLPSVSFADPSTTSPQQGYGLGTTESTRSMAMGGALTALGSSTTAIYENPANLPFAQVFDWEGSVAYSPEARRQNYGAAVADAVRKPIMGGFAVSYGVLDPDGVDRTWTDMRLSLAYPITNAIAFGLTGRYLNLHQAVGRGPFQSSLVSDGTPDGSLWAGFTFDAGLTLQPYSTPCSENAAAVGPQCGLRIGFVGHNLTVPRGGIVPTTASGGIGYTVDVFSIEGDALVDFTTWGRVQPRYSGGVEILVAGHVPIRAGYRYDNGLRTQSVSLGSGYIDRKFGIELSARRDIVADHPMTMFALALRYFYDGGTTDSVGMME